MKEFVSMSNSKISLCKTVFIAATSAIVLAGCSNQFAASMREVTYASDFKYTEQAVLRSDMGKLAQQMSLLEEALT
jgi:outer membrane murein-binding lipoprotein Lpp